MLILYDSRIYSRSCGGNYDCTIYIKGEYQFPFDFYCESGDVCNIYTSNSANQTGIWHCDGTCHFLEEEEKQQQTTTNPNSAHATSTALTTQTQSQSDSLINSNDIKITSLGFTSGHDSNYNYDHGVFNPGFRLVFSSTIVVNATRDDTIKLFEVVIPLTIIAITRVMVS